MRKYIYFIGTITGIFFVVELFKRAEVNDLYEDARQHRVRQLNKQGQIPGEFTYGE